MTGITEGQIKPIQTALRVVALVRNLVLSNPFSRPTDKKIVTGIQLILNQAYSGNWYWPAGLIYEYEASFQVNGFTWLFIFDGKDGRLLVDPSEELLSPINKSTIEISNGNAAWTQVTPPLVKLLGQDLPTVTSSSDKRLYEFIKNLPFEGDQVSMWISEQCDHETTDGGTICVYLYELILYINFCR